MIAASALAALLALAPAAQAQQPAERSAAAPSDSAAPGARATTVFVDATFGSRTGGSAKALNRKHAEMEAQGWRFSSLAPYVENGDLVGFFVTYVR